MQGHSRRIRLLAPLWLALLVVAPVAAGDAPHPFRVIAHPDVPRSSVSREFLANAFLKNITRWPNDQAIRPVDLKLDAPTRKGFSEAVLRRSVAAMKAYWQQRIFSGRGVPPPALESDQAVVDYVTSHPGAVGYISAAAAPGSAKVITVTP
jgi:ABC-type phosphate transport system substrate-binding protein